MYETNNKSKSKNRKINQAKSTKSKDNSKQ